MRRDRKAETTARPVEEWRRRAEVAAEIVRRSLGQAMDSLLQERQFAPAEQAALARRLADKSLDLLAELRIDASLALDGRLGSLTVPVPVQHMLTDLAPILPPMRGPDESAQSGLRGSKRFDDVAHGLVERNAVPPESICAVRPPRCFSNSCPTHLVFCWQRHAHRKRKPEQLPRDPLAAEATRSR